MPLIHTEEAQHSTSIGVWEIHEDLDFFRERLELNQEDNEFLDSIHPRRSLEWAASRYLLKTLAGTGAPFACLYDVHGRPYIPGDSRIISISHSYGMTAVGISNMPFGIDIQKGTDKIIRIQNKFIGIKERDTIGAQPERSLLHLAWGAKEAMFKLYSKGNIDFRKNLLLNLPREVSRYGLISGSIIKGEEIINCNLYYRFIHGFIWVYATPV